MTSNGGFGSFRHLAWRFVGALDPRGPAPAEEAWAMGWLVPGEQDLWRRMSGPDRRHAAGVAREVGRLLAVASPPREVMASALLHDVGKIESGLGTFSRVAVTVAALVTGRERLTRRPGRVKDYLTHDRIGARLLEAAGSDPLTVAWAREHHLPPAEWSVPREVAEALKTADGD